MQEEASEIEVEEVRGMCRSPFTSNAPTCAQNRSGRKWREGSEVSGGAVVGRWRVFGFVWLWLCRLASCFVLRVRVHIVCAMIVTTISAFAVLRN